MERNYTYLVHSGLPDSDWLWQLYDACITSEKVLKILGHKGKENKERRRVLHTAFEKGDQETLDCLLERNLEIIKSSQVVPIEAALYIRRLREYAK